MCVLVSIALSYPGREGGREGGGREGGREREREEREGGREGGRERERREREGGREGERDRGEREREREGDRERELYNNLSACACIKRPHPLEITISEVPSFFSQHQLSADLER